MAKLSPQGKFSARANDGTPLSGGLLYTYEAGTSTPKPTYTDESEGTANANPVVLDGDGYADVWLTDGAYKFILKDSSDVDVWGSPSDNITGDSTTAFGSSVIEQSTNLTVTSVYYNNVFICTSSPTFSLLSFADAGEGFYIVVKNDGAGTVTIDPFSAETIDGNPTLTIAPNESAMIIASNDADWHSLFLVPSILGLNNTFTGDNTFSGDNNFANFIQFSADSKGFSDQNGNEVLSLGTAAASAVNYLEVFNSAAGNAPKVTAAGTDTDIDLEYEAKGTGGHVFNAEVTAPSAAGDMVATQAEQETATAINKVVAPGRQNFHPSAAKAWVNFNGTGTVAIRDSRNVTSITDNGVGLYQVNFTNNMANANYVAVVTTDDDGGIERHSYTQGQATTDYDIRITGTGSTIDVSEVKTVVFGDLA